MSRKVLPSPELLVRRRRTAPVSLRPPGKAVAAIARELLDALDAPAVLVEGGFEIRGSNSAFEKTHGVSGEAARLVDDSGVRPELRALVREAIRLDGEARSDVSTVDGSLLLRARPIRSSGEELVVVTVEDVAETVRTSEETRQLREICARLLDSSVDGIFAFDRDLRFTIWNRSMERISGVTAVEALGRSALLVIPDFMKSGAEAHFRQALDGKAVFTKTTPFRRLEPGRAVVSEGFYAPLHAGDESISGALGIIRDVTGAVRTEEALKDSEERYWKLLEDSLTGNFVATAEGHIVACNAAFVRIFGLTSVDHAVTRSFRSFFSDPRAAEAFFEALRTRKKLENHELYLVREDGEARHLVANFIGSFDRRGDLRDFRGFLFDNTERRLLEGQLRQAQKMESIGTLAGGIAHDFNNILNVILSHTTLLERGDEGRRAASVDAVRTAVERGSGVVRQLLTFARKADERVEPVDVNAAVDEFLKLGRAMFPSSIDFEVKKAPGLAPVKADRTQLHQALLNLCINARDAMPAGGTLSLSTFATRGRSLRRRHPEATDGDYVSLQVRDTGFGMDAETIQRVFDPFFTSKEPGRGAGLGLAVAYGSVKSRGGFIDVESEVGKGTDFTIHLPATKAAVAAPEVSRKAVAGGSETVLLVEDERLLLEALEALVEGEGYRVLTASDGVEALAIYKENRGSIRAVVADLGLPSLGGWELYLELREIDPAVAVILASGYVEKLEKIEMLETGVKRVLSKPYSADDVLRALREVLDEVSATTS